MKGLNIHSGVMFEQLGTVKYELEAQNALTNPISIPTLLMDLIFPSITGMSAVAF